MPICPECGKIVSNLKRHFRRKRCDKTKSEAMCRRRVK